jgi:TolB protein
VRTLTTWLPTLQAYALAAWLSAWPVIAQEVSQSRPGLAFQVTHTVIIDPSFAPDGQHMIYITVVAGVEQLFVANTDGTNSRQITRDDFGHEDPAWSPDGTKVGFVSLANGGEVISIMEPNGANVEALTPANVRAIHPNWAPNNRSILYCTDDDLRPPAKNSSEIDIIDVGTRRITPLITGGINTYPAFSPDAQHIAFRRILGESNSEVFIADANGANQRNLTADPAFDGWPSWSPDGLQIAFASNRRGNYQIFVMRAGGGDVRLVANTEGRATAPAWTKDGTSIYFPVCRKVDFGGDCQIFAAPAPQLPR